MVKNLQPRRLVFRLIFLMATSVVFGCVTLFGENSTPPGPSQVTATLAVSPTPTENPVSDPPIPEATQSSGGTVKGAIYLDSPDRKPFVTVVDLRRISNSKYLFSQETDSEGQFSFLSVPPDRYDLWAFLTADSSETLGCSDVVMKGGENSFGVRYVEDDIPLTVPQESLETVIELERSMRKSEANPKTPKGYYAASNPIVVKAGETVEIVIEMVCQ